MALHASYTEVTSVLADTAKQYMDVPADRSADGPLRAGLEILLAQGLEASEVKALLRFALHNSASNACLNRREGQESVGDSMTLKDLSLVKVLW